MELLLRDRICVLGVLLGVADFDSDAEEPGEGQSEGRTVDGCGAELYRNTLGFLATLCVTVLLELAVAVVSMRGTILNVQPRSAMPYLLYARLRTFYRYIYHQIPVYIITVIMIISQLK